MAKTNILRRFRDDKSGSAYVLAALSMMPIFGMMALAIDYTNQDRVYTDLETATQTVALHLAKRVALDPSGIPAEFEEEGKKLLEALVSEPVTYDKFAVDVDSGKVQIIAKSQVKTYFMHMFGYEHLDARVQTESRFGRKNIEVAIAIDNSGSMDTNAAALGQRFKSRMDSAKDGAKTLINVASDSVANIESADIKFSVVPWNQQVRVPNDYLGSGNKQDAWWIDWEGKSVDHFRYLAPYKTTNSDGANKGDMFYEMPRRQSFWPDAKSREWVYYDPNKLKDVLPLTPNGEGVDIETLKKKDGIGIVTRKDVFDRFKNASWKGCFDHRAGKYREIFDAPNPQIGNSLYLPHFAPDEYDRDTRYDYYGIVRRINYIDDVNSESDFAGYDRDNLNSTSWSDNQHLSVRYRNSSVFTPQDIMRARTFNTPKYVGGKTYTNNITMGYYARERVGPDIDCFVPPMIGLSSDVDGINNNKKDGALAKTIDSMEPEGATDLSIGLAWAMNTLTPWEPMAGAGDFEDTEKVLVLMTDGDNTINFPNDYGYGHSPHGYAVDDPYEKGWGLSGPSSSETANSMLDDVSKAMCTNIKGMGVRIYFIYFGSTKYSTRAGKLMDHCASSAQSAIWAKNDVDLENAFKKIGSDIGKLRLTHYGSE
ncbi:hypothetical protein WNY59_00780 [Ahrensia kielensis]|uniref:Flp pilus-assembly TadG-like N-terminal domain-containing protein n=1 Tax=Ahrensia kielensis TaxID=76980 RepID=A0ABU9T2Y4_9HYPH